MIPFSLPLPSSVLKLLIICSHQCLRATYNYWTAFNWPPAFVRLLLKKSIDQKPGINHVISFCQARNGQHAKICIKRYTVQSVPIESEIFDTNS